MYICADVNVGEKEEKYKVMNKLKTVKKNIFLLQGSFAEKSKRIKHLQRERTAKKSAKFSCKINDKITKNCNRRRENKKVQMVKVKNRENEVEEAGLNFECLSQHQSNHWRA